MNSSFAFWIELDEHDNHNKHNSHNEHIDNEVIRSKLHINFWNLKNNCALDIGILFDVYHSSDIFCIYIPFAIDAQTDFLDLGSRLDTKETARSIFNESLTVSASDYKNYFTIEPKEKNTRLTQFNVLCIREHCIKKIKTKKGTILKFNTPHYEKEGEKTYIRFRIKSKNLSCLFTKVELPNAVLQYFNSEIHVLDIRFNDIRTLEPQVFDAVMSHKSIVFTSIDFLLMCNSTIEVMLASCPYAQARIIEHDIWTEYLKPIQIPQQEAIIGYHWKKRGKNREGENDETFTSFSVFTKIKTEWLSLFKIFSIAIFVVFLGALGSKLAALL